MAQSLFVVRLSEESRAALAASQIPQTAAHRFKIREIKRPTNILREQEHESNARLTACDVRVKIDLRA